MPTATIDDVWIYIYEQGDVRTRDLEQRFVKSNARVFSDRVFKNL